MNSSGGIRVLIVERFPIVQQALVSTLHSLVAVVSVDVVTSLAEARVKASCTTYGLLIVDAVASGTRESREFDAVRAHVPGAPILLFSQDESKQTLDAARAAGIEGFVGKRAVLPSLLSAVEKLLEGGTVYPVQRSVNTPAQVTLPEHFPVMLSARRQHILARVLEGQTNRDIANALGIAEGTVKNHVSHIMRAFSVDNRPRLMLRARELGLG